jgi:glycerol uptake facilitator-like aquaporin
VFFPCISGGHLNPAVTLGLTAVGRLRPVLLPVYWAGQYLGAFIAALVLWGVYSDAILLVGHHLTDAYYNSRLYTANESPVRIQYKCLLVPIYVFPEMKLCSLVISKTEL